MSRERHDLEELEEPVDELELGDDTDDLEDAGTDEPEADEEPLEPTEDDATVLAEDGDAEQTSWEELLAQRAAKHGAEDGDEVSDLMSLADEPVPVVESAPRRPSGVRERGEFMCRSCHLVKPRTQLADEARVLCRDCA